MELSTTDFKKGLCLKLEGKYYFIVEFLHVKPGKGQAFVRTKLKNVITGYIIDKTFNTGLKIEVAQIKRYPYQFLYRDNNGYNFMNSETFEQIFVVKENIIGVNFLKEGEIVDVVINTESGLVLFVELPNYVILSITNTDYGIKGNTVTNITKPATLETGVIIRVPLFINIGEKIRINTKDGSYVERVK